eukprot:GEMP01010923.1.p1 GENE.GEMP01010923.1~~GEMP01010923.1.p1  ORF type:complete len:731 (+),score=150.31 GEMP01010923.1:60-2252(+)
MDRALLNKATAPDETPTPGYMYTEIAKITFAGFHACEQLEDYLLKKLPKDNSYVKLKCLRIIKHVCEQGKPDFKRNLQKRADVVKACLSYRGAPDPLKGDAPSKEVREQAEECLKSIFNADQQNAYGQVNRPQEMQGFGSTNGHESDNYRPSAQSYSNTSYSNPPYSGGGIGGGPSYQGPYESAGGRNASGGMIGFGNPAFEHNSKEAPTLLQRASDTAWAQISKLSGKLPTIQRGASMGGQADFHNAPLPGGPTTWQPPPMPSSMSSNRWGSDSGGRPPVHTREEPGLYETRIIDDLCALGGARVALSQTVLDDFCQTCESLDAKVVGEQLVRKLNESEWQVKLKALCAVEALVDANLDGVTGVICDRGYDALAACQQVAQCRARAQKVLRLLGFESDAAPPASPTQQVPVPASTAAAVADLLDLGEPAPASIDLVGGDLFTELSTAPKQAVTAATAGTAAQATVAPTGNNLFSGLGVHGDAANALNTAACGGNNSSLLDDMLGDTSASGAYQAPAVPLTTANDLLADFTTAAPAPTSLQVQPAMTQQPLSPSMVAQHQFMSVGQNPMIQQPAQSSAAQVTPRRDAHFDVLSYPSRGSMVYPPAVANAMMGSGAMIATHMGNAVPLMGVYAAQPMMGQPMQGQPMQGQPMHGQPMQGQPIMGTCPTSTNFGHPMTSIHQMFPASQPTTVPKTNGGSPSAFNFISASGKPLPGTSSQADNFNFVQSQMLG